MVLLDSYPVHDIIHVIFLTRDTHLFFLNLRIPQEWQNTMTEFYKELQEQACYCGFHYGLIEASNTIGNHQRTVLPTP